MIKAYNQKYSNPKWFVETHSAGVRFHKTKKSTNDLGLLYMMGTVYELIYELIYELSL